LPGYVFADPMAKEAGADVAGGGIGAEIGLWLEGRPLRGWYIKGHAEYNWITLRTKRNDGSELDQEKIPKTLVGALFGTQNIIGGFFTYSWGIGIVKDLSAKERDIWYLDNGKEVLGTIPKSGLLENGIDLITQLQIGVTF